MSRGGVLAGYLALQAVLVAAWWGLVIVVPSTRAWFEPPGRPEVLTAFWPADGVLLCLGSVVACVGVARRAAWAAASVWVVFGGFAYATLYCIGLVLHAGGPWLPVLVMAPACVATAACAARQ